MPIDDIKIKLEEEGYDVRSVLIYNCWFPSREKVLVKLHHIDLLACYQFYQKVFEKIVLQSLATLVDEL